MENRTRGEPHRTLMICIDSFDSDVPQGHIYSQQNEDGLSFNSLMQLLSIAEDNFEKINFPQAFLKMREFQPRTAAPPPTSSESKMRKGRLATFSIRLMFRQNASWQGSVSWLEGSSEETFRSALELIFLMKSALDSKKQTAIA